jgi:REP element-mobilizing transposase RayT
LFLTWRLHGSLPFWIHAPSVTSGRAFVRLDRQLDTAPTGPMWLKDPRVAAAVVDSLRFAEGELRLFDLRAWVVMSNHVHLLLFPWAPLCRINKSVRGFTARQANRTLGRIGQPFWQHESFDHWVRDRGELERTAGYIEANPVKAGLVECAADWPWSSASQQTADPSGRLDHRGPLSRLLP